MTAIRALASVVALALLGILLLVSGGDYRAASSTSTAPAVAGNPGTANAAYERWRRARVMGPHADRLALTLVFSRARSQRHTEAQGLAVFDFSAGILALDLDGLPPGQVVEVRLVDESRPRDSQRVTLGRLETAGGGRTSAVFDLSPAALAGRVLHRLEVGPADDGSAGLLHGSPSLFQRLYFAERRGWLASTPAPATQSGVLPGLLAAIVPAPVSADGTGADLAALVAQGEQLFFNETFAGNGRTCGTCHPADNNFTIDPTYIATLPADHPLFVAENVAALAQLENPILMRQHGLILANIDGFEDPTNKFVMRSVSHTLAMAASIQSDATEAPFERTGWSGDGAPGQGRLRDFATGAVVQHFTQRLDRVEGTDFRLPTEAELDAIEAFMLSLGRPTDFDLTTLALADSTAESGRLQFLVTDSLGGTENAAKCQLCHQNAGALTETDADKIFNGNFDTGIEARASLDPTDPDVHPAVAAGHTLPVDGGFGIEPDTTTGGLGDGTFNAPPLWEAADTGGFFHNNQAESLEAAAAHYTSVAFKDSPEGFLLRSRDSATADIEVEVDDIAAFLRILNVMENLRASKSFLERCDDAVSAELREKHIELALADIADAIEVLTEGELHQEDALPLIRSASATLAAALDLGDFAGLGEASAAAQRNLASARTLIVVREPTPIEPPLSVAPPAASPDMNGDGVVNFLDLGVLKSVFFSTDSRGDFNQDGVVNFLDLGIMKSMFFQTVTNPPGGGGSAGGGTTPPSVQIQSPLPASTVQGTVTISALASDDVGVTHVVFTVDGTLLLEDDTSPFEASWDTGSIADGVHTIQATAFDAEGASSSATVQVEVHNPPPPPCTSPYGCGPGAAPPPPPPSVPPPSDTSSLPEFKGVVTSKDMERSTMTIEALALNPVTGVDEPNGVFRILLVHDETTFNSDFAANLLHVLPGHRVEGKFIFTTAGREVVSVEVSLLE